MSMMSLNFDLSMNDDLWYENYHCLKQQLKSLKTERSKWIQKQQQCKNKIEEYTTTPTIQNCLSNDNEDIPLYQIQIWRDNYQNFTRYYDIVSETIEHLNKQINAVQHDIKLTLQ
jgi:hypothetical protein